MATTTNIGEHRPVRRLATFFAGFAALAVAAYVLGNRARTETVHTGLWVAASLLALGAGAVLLIHLTRKPKANGPTGPAAR
jgi:uncharacterized MAPEG superfamily protein